MKELKQAVKELQQAVKEQQQEVKELKEGRKCKICYEHDVVMVFLPCTHQVCCEG